MYRMYHHALGCVWIWQAFVSTAFCQSLRWLDYVRIPVGDLPPVDGMPQGCAWGVFDQDSQKDKLGTLNLLTLDVVQSAAAEIKEGV